MVHMSEHTRKTILGYRPLISNTKHSHDFGAYDRCLNDIHHATQRFGYSKEGCSQFPYNMRGEKA